jgi:hypothetical protein
MQMAKGKQPKNLLTLDQREAKLGNSINTWALKMGKTDTAPAKSIQVSTTISRAELCSLLREPLAGESFFNDKAGLAEPLYATKIGAIAISGDFTDSELRIYVGIDMKQITLDPVTLTGLKFVPLTGGRSTLKFQAQYKPQESDDLRELERWLDHDCKIEALVGKVIKIAQAQPELPMQHDAPPATVEQAIAADAKCSHGISMAEDCQYCDAEGFTERQPQAASPSLANTYDMDSKIGDGKSTQELIATKKQKARAAPGEGKRQRPSRSKAAKAEREARSHATH